MERRHAMEFRGSAAAALPLPRLTAVRAGLLIQ